MQGDRLITEKNKRSELAATNLDKLNSMVLVSDFMRVSRTAHWDISPT